MRKELNLSGRNILLIVWTALIPIGGLSSVPTDSRAADTRPEESAVQSETSVEHGTILSPADELVESRGLAPMPGKSQPSANKPMQEPSWPQTFDVRGPETDGFGFAVTLPGPIVIDVQAQGPPITVTLRGPGLPPHVQSGAGRVQFTHQATPQEVSRGIFWGISIALQQPGPAQAVGQVHVHHPPADPTKVHAAAAAQQQAAQQQAAQRQAAMQQAGAQAATQMEAAFQRHKAQFEQQRQQRHAGLMAKAQPLIDQLRMRGPGQVRTRGIEGADSTTPEAPPEKSTDIETRGLSRTRPTGPIMQAPNNAPPVMMKVPETPSSPPLQSTSSAITYMPDPVITSLSVTQGQPGDPVVISGNGFGDEGGEVHFAIGQGKDLIAPPGVVWRNDQIFATVPEATGVHAYNGILYIKRAVDSKTSGLFPFKFEPSTELRNFRLPGDFNDLSRKIDPWLYAVCCLDISPDKRRYLVWYSNLNIFWGFKETDEYFLNTRLKNGWVLDDVFFISTKCEGGCNYLLEKHVGSDRPYFSVRYWLNAGFTASHYEIHQITIHGPKGLPDGLVVP